MARRRHRLRRYLRAYRQVDCLLIRRQIWCGTEGVFEAAGLTIGGRVGRLEGELRLHSVGGVH